MKKMYVFLTILFTGILFSPSSLNAQVGCMDAAACNYNSAATTEDNSCLFDIIESIRDNTNYIATTGFSLGSYQAEGDWTPAGFVLADQFQINLEYQDGVDSSGVDVWNDWAGVIGDGTGVNWHDPENYVLSIDVDGGLNASQYTGDSNNPLNDYSENLQWTITGWDHTILGGYIENGKLVVSPPNTYRPFDAALNVNVQENFSGFTQTELTALTFTGDVNDIGLGTVFGVEMISDCVCESDTDGDGICDDGSTNVSAGYPYDACPNDANNDIDGDGICADAEIGGCIDETACNYDETATDDDGSCTYEAVNADCDGNCLEGYTSVDAICVTIIEGCIDTVACNFDEEIGANTDDGSCIYAVEYFDCDGNCLNDADEDSVCDELEVLGCQDTMACNYDSTATEPGECIGVLGCNYGWMSNYTPDANCFENDFYTNNEACIPWVLGCTDITACNYNEDANGDDDSCEYPIDLYPDLTLSDKGGLYCYVDCFGICLYDEDEDGVCDEVEVAGCTNPEACNYDEDATDDDGSCVDEDNPCDVCEDGVVIDNDADDDGICDADEIAGCQDDSFCNYDASATDSAECIGIVLCNDPASFNFYDNIQDGFNNVDCFDNSICIEWVSGCTDTNACNYDENANYDDASCVYPGCMNALACNYEPNAACDDGSCEMPGCDQEWAANYNTDATCIDNETCEQWLAGCMDNTACNFDPLANADIGCVYPPFPWGSLVPGCQECIYDEDGVISGAADVDVDEDGVLDCNEVEGCTQTEACNYNTNATEDDGSCNIPSVSDDGIVCDECCKFSSGTWTVENYPGATSILSASGDDWELSTVAYSYQQSEVITESGMTYTDVFSEGNVTSDCYSGPAMVTVSYNTVNDTIVGGINFTIEGGGLLMNSTATITGFDLASGTLMGDVSGGNAGSLSNIDSDFDGIPDCEDEYPHVSIDESDLGFILYPNPTDNLFVVEMSSNEINNFSVKINNQIGQLMVEKSGYSSSELQFDVSNYPAGLYQVAIITNNQTINTSVIVK